MSSYPLVKFVDSPATSAVVRYDCNDQVGTPAKKVTDFDPGVPTLEGDPDAVGQQWGFRSPQIVHTIKGTKAQAMAALSAVSKEQLRRTNWVMYQLSAATSPRWFKTYRTGYQPVTLDQVFVRTDGGGLVALPDTWKITIPLVADAFTYGAKVTMSTFQVIQGPVDLAGPTRTAMHVVLPAIKGDAPTGLRVSVTPNGFVSGNFPLTSAWLLGCSSGASTMTDPVVDIGTGDTFIPGTGTAAPTTDATYFGGSYRAVTIAAAGPPNLIQRLQGTLTVVPVGRYKIFLRAAFIAGAAKTLQFRLNLFITGGPILVQGPTVSVPTQATDNGRKFWVELGDFQIPSGVTAPSDGGATVAAQSIGLDIGTLDGSASSVNIDAFKLIPIDGPLVSSATLLRVQPGGAQWLQQGSMATYDSDLQQTWLKDTTSGSYQPGWVPILRGAYPLADPAADVNILHMIALDPGQGTTSVGVRTTDLNVASSVDVSYYPRFLHVGDGT